MQPSERGTPALFVVLGKLGDSVKQRGSGYMAHCPGPGHHRGDRKPSLSISLGYDSRVLLNCHTGCSAEDICAAIGLTLADLYEQSPDGNPVRRFRVIDPTNGKIEAEHVREDRPDDKVMHWERNGKRTLGDKKLEDLDLYRLPELLKAPKGSTVFLCEGESDTDALAERGVLAVGTVTGGGKKCPSDRVLRPLVEYDVVLWCDNDTAGRLHMQLIADRLVKLGA